MEFRQLEYFCMISKLESFTRAAELLHVSQPSVTKAIKVLETELKMTLIDRSKKHITLTPEGKAFLVHSKKILADVNDALQEMAKFQANQQGVLNLGIPPMIESYIFPDIFTKFKQLYPNIELNISEYGYSDLVRAKLEEGKIDLGILVDNGEFDDDSSLCIMRDRLSVCVSKVHPFNGAASVSFDQLKDEKFVLQHKKTHQYQAIQRRCHEYGFSPKIVLCSAQIKTIKQLVANNTGIAVLMDLVTRADKNYTVIPLEPEFNIQIKLIWSDSRCQSHVIVNFLEFIKQYIDSQESLRLKPISNGGEICKCHM